MGGCGCYSRSNEWAGQLQKVKWVGGAVTEGQMNGWGSYSYGFMIYSKTLLFRDVPFANNYRFLSIKSDLL